MNEIIDEYSKVGIIDKDIDREYTEDSSIE
jgi:hypothetical protein